MLATGDDRAALAPVPGLWVLSVSVALPVLGTIELRRGEMLFGTVGMVFGGLPGFGAGLPFVRGLFLPGTSVMGGYWSLSTSFVFFLLLPAMLKASRPMAGGWRS